MGRFSLEDVTQALAKPHHDVSLSLAHNLTVRLECDSRRTAYSLFYAPTAPWWVPLNIPSLLRYCADDPVVFPDVQTLVEEFKIANESLTHIMTRPSYQKIMRGMFLPIDPAAERSLAWSVVAQGITHIQQTLQQSPAVLGRNECHAPELIDYYNTLRYDADIMQRKTELFLQHRQLDTRGIDARDMRPVRARVTELIRATN